MYDKNKLNEIKLIDICKMYGVKLERHGKTLTGMIRNEKTPSFHIYENSNIWVDFGTGEKGGSIKLIQILEGVEWNEAIHILADKFGISSNKSLYSKSSLPTKKQFEEIGINPDRAISNFIIDLEKQPISKVEEWEAKYSISMYELAEKNTYMYHKLLDSRALPIIYDERKLLKKLQEKYPNLETDIEKELLKYRIKDLEKSINYKVDIYNKARLDKMKKYYLKIKSDR